jgi:hypothetical protein
LADQSALQECLSQVQQSSSSTSVNSQGSSSQATTTTTTSQLTASGVALNQAAALLSNSLSLIDENNPFDVTENRDYFKNQDVDDIKQLIINVCA